MPEPPAPGTDEALTLTSIALAISHASVALEWVTTPEVWPAFAAWIAANPDTADLRIGIRQIRAADAIVSILATHMLGTTMADIKTELGGEQNADKLISRALTDLLATINRDQN